MQDYENPRLRKDNIILNLEVIDGKKPKSSTGLIDPRVLSGENSYSICKDPRNNLWGFKVRAGGLPPELKQKFTTFEIAFDYGRRYFENRNMKITGIQD